MGLEPPETALPNISCGPFRACLQSSWASETILRLVFQVFHRNILEPHWQPTQNLSPKAMAYGFNKRNGSENRERPNIAGISSATPWESLFLDYFGLSHGTPHLRQSHIIPFHPMSIVFVHLGSPGKPRDQSGWYLRALNLNLRFHAL